MWLSKSAFVAHVPRPLFPVALLTLSVLLPASEVANGAAGGVPMAVTLGPRQFCQILLVNDGTITSDATGTVLGSQQAGGAPGRVVITTTNGSYNFFHDMPSAFTAEPVGNPGPITFTGTASGTGATTFTGLAPSTAMKLKKGATDILAHLTATNAGGPFVAGNYTATTTVRCE